jgi:rhamnose transport system ATP-binding protein
VAENVFVGREVRRLGGRRPQGQRTKVLALLERIGLGAELADVRVADLPVAEQQLVSIAKALSQQPRILILDEPSAILTDREIETLFVAVRALRDGGVAVIYISHRLDELAQITDRVTVLRDGLVVASRPTSSLSVREVAELMVGHSISSTTAERPVGQGAPVLEVSGLTRMPKFAGIDLTLGPGEIVALYGLIGSGAGDVVRALFGIDPAHEGTIQVQGKVVALNSPSDAVAQGITMLPGQPQGAGRVRHEEHRLQRLERTPAHAQPVGCVGRPGS